MIRLFFVIICLFSSITSCSLSENYNDPETPLYSGDYRTDSVLIPDTLKLVSFNIKYSRRPREALNLLNSYSQLKDAHVILLQEMQNKDVETISRNLNCQYIYYPATFHIVAGHDFGNAILSKFKLSDPEKIVLPHLNPVNKSIRIAVMGSAHVGSKRIRLVSLHLETPLMRSNNKQDQVQAVLDEIQHQNQPIIIGGDFNTAFKNSARMINSLMTRNGYTNVTRNSGYTMRGSLLPFFKFKLDHIYSKHVYIHDSGKVIDFSASDHLPLWFTFSL
ncbi:MAG: endonuclease/exonuclease/phosphatase family protein [candidate division KSB1 bacterium]|nr:endonuclease/exonuclease/phosphatase family protein [candidate division KSB1 bacterium]